MTEEFNVRLDDVFRNAADHRDWREAWKKQAQGDPLGTAVRVREAIAEGLARERAESAKLYGIDVSDPAAGEDYDLQTLAEAAGILQRVNHYRILLWAQQKLDSYAADSSLSEQEHATKVCEVGLESWQALDALVLHTLRQIRLYAAPGEATRLAEDVEATHLAGHLATRISVAINRRLAKALDDIREHNKSAKRERFEALLRELYIYARPAWDEHHALDWQLNATRNAATRKVEERLRQDQSAEAELAAFADKEALLTHAKAARLSAQELEAFELFVQTPKLKYREIADHLGISTNQVGVIKHRISNKLAAGF